MSTSRPVQGPTFMQALNRFKAGLTAGEICTFEGTTFEDVWNMAEDLQREQSSRHCMQGWARIGPFLTGIKTYSDVIGGCVQRKAEILAFIWGPVKVLLQIASKYASHFERLVNALQSVGENLPRFIAYERIFPHDGSLQDLVVAMVYEDIMEFVRRTWEFFRRGSWNLLFDSLWDDFGDRFKSILGRLKSFKELVDKEVPVSEIQDEVQKAESVRRRAEEEFEKTEKKRISTQRRDIYKWINGTDPEDDKERAGEQRHPETGLWLFERRQFQDWLNGNSGVLWVTGIPGCGKTVLASAMIDYLQNDQRKQVLYFFFSFRNMCRNTLHELLRAYISQYLRLNPDLLPVADHWLQESTQVTASLRELKKHFKEILLICADPKPIYLILDGLDECDDAEQSIIQRYLHITLQEVVRSGKLHLVRPCVISREIKLEGAFNKLVNPRVRVGKTDNKVDINNYIISELNQVKEKLEPHIHLEEGYTRELIETLTVRAEGMFLWVRLVIGSFLNATRLNDIEEGVRNLPHGLDQAYGRILQQIVERSHANSKLHQETLIILKWLACVCRPVTLSEVKSWLAIDVQSSRHVGRPSIVEGGLLTEILPDSTVQFVHFSAKEYILAGIGGDLHTSPFFRLIDAHLDAFRVCITYLSLDFLSVDATDEMRQLQHLLNGDYHLLSYSNSYWIHHLRECLRLRPDSTTMMEIVGFLSQFLQASKGDITDSQGILPASKMKQEMGPLALLETVEGMGTDHLSILFAVVSYNSKLDTKYKEGISVQDLHTWHRDHQPLILTERFWQVQTLLEGCMAGQDVRITPADRDNLKQLYDRGIYLCRHPACEGCAEMEGFSTSGERERHEDSHSRPFVCSDPSCTHGWAKLGFSTKKELNKHLQKFHGQHRDAGDDGSVSVDPLDYILLNDTHPRGQEEGEEAVEGGGTGREEREEEAAQVPRGSPGLDVEQLKRGWFKKTGYFTRRERSDFQLLLASYGTNWEAIARRLASKTPSRLKLIYDRSQADSSWRIIAEKANRSIAAGEWLPEPPPLDPKHFVIPVTSGQT